VLEKAKRRNHSGAFSKKILFNPALLSKLGGIIVSNDTLSADAPGYSFRAKGSESFMELVGL
jgi:hypothetical protein